MRLAVPSPDAPFEERREAFERLRPEGMQVTDVYYQSQIGSRHERFIGDLRLADGTTLSDPELLLSGVEPESETARAVASYQRYRRAARRGVWISRGLGLGAVAMFAASFAFHDKRVEDGMLISSGGLLLGWIGARFAIRHASRRRERAIEVAYRSFDGDLARHLHLCPDDEEVNECP